MADDLAPPQIRSGGGGSVDVSGVTAPDYRQLQAPILPGTDIPNYGAAAHAEALSSAFKQFGGMVSDVDSKFLAEAGRRAGAAADPKNPNFREGLARLTVYGEAYNNAALGTYAIDAKGQASALASQLRVQANGDPDKFRQLYTAAAAGTLKQAPAFARQELTRIYGENLNEIHTAMVYDQMNKDRDNHRNVYQQEIDRTASRVAYLRANGQEDQAKEEEMRLYGVLIPGGQNAGLFTKEEADAQAVATNQKVYLQTWETRMDNVMSQGGNVNKVLESFWADHTANLNNPNDKVLLNEDQYSQVMSKMTERARNYRLATQGDQAEVTKEQRDRAEVLAGGIPSGRTTPQMVADAVGQHLITLGQFATIMSNVQRDTLISNVTSARNRAALRADPRFQNGDITPLQILQAPLNGADQDALIKERETVIKGWEGTPSNKLQMDRLHQYLFPGKQPGGAFMSAADQKDWEAAKNDYTSRMLALNPEDRIKSDIQQKVATQIINQHEIGRLQRDMETAQSILQRVYDAADPNNPNHGDYWKTQQQGQIAIQQQRDRMKDIQDRIDRLRRE